MKKIVLQIVPFILAAFFLQGCSVNNPLEENTTEEDLNVDDPDSKTVVAQEVVYYIQESRAGIPERSFVPTPYMVPLRPLKATVLMQVHNAFSLSLYIQYRFGFELFTESEFWPPFSVVVEDIPYAKDGEAFVVDSENLKGLCKRGEEKVDYTEVSLKGVLDAGGCRLSLDGQANGYPFALDISQASSSQEDFTPETMEPILVDGYPMLEMEVTNNTSGNVDFTLHAEFHPGSALYSQAYELAPGEARVFGMYSGSLWESYVEIVYGEDNKVKLSGQDFLYRSSDTFRRNDAEPRWFFMGHENGSIDKIDFTRWLFSIEEP